MGPNNLDNAYKPNEQQSQTQENVGDILGLEQKIDNVYSNLLSVAGIDSDNDCLTFLNSLPEEEVDILKNIIDKADPFDLEDLIILGLPNLSNIENYKLIPLPTKDIEDNKNKTEKEEDITEKEEDITEKEEDITEKEEDITEKEEDTTENKEDTTEKNEQIIRDKVIFDSKIGDINLENFGCKDKIEELLKINNVDQIKIKVQELIDYFKDNPEELQELLGKLHDKVDGSFEAFSGLLVSVDGAGGKFDLIVKEFELQKASSKKVVEKGLEFSLANARASAYTNSVMEGDKLIADLGSNIEAVTDYSKNPPKRVITNGKYELASEPFLGPLLKPSIEYKKRVGDLQEERKSLGVDRSKIITEGNEKSEEIDDLKSQMELIGNSEIGEDDKMYTDLKERLVIAEKELADIVVKVNQKDERIKEIDAEILKTKNEYIRVVQDSQEAYAEGLRKRDEKKKKTLRFLDGIGFDEIPQGATNSIIERINTGSEKSVFGFRNNINLANGNLGTNLDGDLNSFGIKEMKFFAEFMNVLLSGEKGKPIDADSMEHGLPVFKDEGGEVIANKDTYIKKIMGVDPLGTMNKNIHKFKVFGEEGEKEEEKVFGGEDSEKGEL